MVTCCFELCRLGHLNNLILHLFALLFGLVDSVGEVVLVTLRTTLVANADDLRTVQARKLDDDNVLRHQLPFAVVPLC